MHFWPLVLAKFIFCHCDISKVDIWCLRLYYSSLRQILLNKQQPSSLKELLAISKKAVKVQFDIHFNIVFGMFFQNLSCFGFSLKQVLQKPAPFVFLYVSPPRPDFSF